jgi:2-oxoglutarate ferredoxin oxidoreductase subunit beta
MDRSKTVFVSGIGCSSRFPYYMNTYGFHTIHGRAPTFATGPEARPARPDRLDGHRRRRRPVHRRQSFHAHHPPQRRREGPAVQQPHLRPDQGPIFPDQRAGKKTKSTPMGAPEYPIRPISIAIGAEATFAARTIDVDVKHLEYVLERAAKHVGTAFVEIYQNCNIFNDGAYDYATDKATKERHDRLSRARQAADLRQGQRKRHPPARPDAKDLLLKPQFIDDNLPR